MLDTDIAREIPSILKNFSRRNKTVAYQIRGLLQKQAARAGVSPKVFFARLLSARPGEAHYKLISSLIYLFDRWDLFPVVGNGNTSLSKRGERRFQSFLEDATLTLKLGTALNFINSAKPLAKKLSKIFSMPLHETMSFVFASAKEELLERPSRYEDPYNQVVLLNQSLLS
jgi:hypothetical protein